MFARIGETPDECVARYGHATKATELVREFLKNDTRIVVHFHEGRADKILYDRPTPFTSKQIDELLERNAPKKTWKNTAFFSDDLPSSREAQDGSTFVEIGLYAGSTRMTVEIITAGARSREIQSAQAQEDKELAGF